MPNTAFPIQYGSMSFTFADPAITTTPTAFIYIHKTLSMSILNVLSIYVNDRKKNGGGGMIKDVLMSKSRNIALYDFVVY